MKQEGYLPKLDSDGDISFKHDGESFWVEVDSFGTGYYVSVVTLTPVDNISIITVRRAMDEATRSLKFLRTYSSTKGDVVSLEYDWVCYSISDFKRMFEDALAVVAEGDKRFIKKLKGD